MLFYTRKIKYPADNRGIYSRPFDHKENLISIYEADAACQTSSRIIDDVGHRLAEPVPPKTLIKHLGFPFRTSEQSGPLSPLMKYGSLTGIYATYEQSSTRSIRHELETC